ncbi:MAG: hypothetical protein DSY70_04560, partial [Desulfobulbus sp.]
RPDAGTKGRVISVANFTAFSCMLLAGRLFPVLDTLFSPSAALQVLGAVSAGAGALLWFALGRDWFV